MLPRATLRGLSARVTTSAFALVFALFAADAVVGIEVPRQPSYKVEGESLTVEDGSGHALVPAPTSFVVRLCGETLCPPLHEMHFPVRVSGKQLTDTIAINGKRLRAGVWFYQRDDGADSDGLRAVNRLPLEEYLVATVGSEMPKAFPPEALKAQAVVSRTYAMSRRMRREGEVVQLASSTLDQVYNGLSHESPETRAAVTATKGQVLVFAHEPVEAFFFSSCGGRTRDSRLVFNIDAPYLRGVACGHCDDAGTAIWKKRLSFAELGAKLGRKITGAKTQGETVDGRPVEVVFTPNGPKYAPEVLRSKLGYTVIKSPQLSVTCDAGGCTFTGRGAGHGVGMCQWGARGLASKGASYLQIVETYFPGAALKTLY